MAALKESSSLEARPGQSRVPLGGNSNLDKYTGTQYMSAGKPQEKEINMREIMSRNKSRD